jgi:hypothetical protein
LNNREDKPSLILKYDITLDDYIEANDAFLKKKNKRTYYFQSTIGVLAALGGLLLVILTNFYYIYGYVILLLGVMIILNHTLIHRIIVKRNWRKEPRIREPRNVTISEDKFIAKDQYSESISSWESFNDFIETKNLFLLFVQRKLFFLIPKRAFDNINMENEFRNILRSKLPSPGIEFVEHNT